MIRKRNGFWTVVFSMLPGAGHMYNGFMKMGVSFMGLFFFVIFLAAWLNIGPLMFLTPIVWFYAFFDCINRRFQDDEDFYMQEDDYLFNDGKIKNMEGMLTGKGSLIAGVLLIIGGIYILWENVFVRTLGRLDFINPHIFNFFYTAGHVAGQMAAAIVIIAVGIMLIKGKKKELDKNADNDGGGSFYERDEFPKEGEEFHD